MAIQGINVISDFVCPTNQTREAYGKPDVLIWVNRIKSSRYNDTNVIWEDPENYDVMIPPGLTVDEEVELVFEKTNLVDWREPHALVLGRFQPWHEGHEWLYQEAGQRTGKVVIGVRNTSGLEKDPLTFNMVKGYIPDNRLVMQLPNITHVVYGRDVGYSIEQVEPPEEIGKVSATEIRKEMNL
jgi:hypothetical protein